MGFLDFLKKKPEVSTQTAVPSTPQSALTPNMPTNSQFDLPELPSFDAQTHTDLAYDLPPLPSFDDQSSPSAPANFSLPPMPTIDNVSKPSNFKDVARESQVNAPAAISPQFSAQSETYGQMPAVDVRTPYGPVFCDVETYREILTNMNHAKDEVIQLQSFAANGLVLQQRTQTQYDNFHNSLSSMAKKLLLAEAKLFK